MNQRMNEFFLATLVCLVEEANSLDTTLLAICTKFWFKFIFRVCRYRGGGGAERFVNFSRVFSFIHSLYF